MHVKRGCIRARSIGGGATGGTFIFASPGDPTSVFPPFVTERVGVTLIDLVFDHLADISSALTTTGDKTFTPRLAKSWTWAPDSLSITYSLDPRARWHDGKPVTAADVRYKRGRFGHFIRPLRRVFGLLLAMNAIHVDAKKHQHRHQNDA